MILDGKKIATEIEGSLKEEIEKNIGRPPALAFILVGHHLASLVYVKMKKKRCSEIGILSVDIQLPEKTSENRLIEEINKLNLDSQVDGILIQLPLPPHLDPHRIIEKIDPNKDVDGFHPINMGKLLLGQPGGFYPSTPYGISILLERAHIETKGKHVVIVGRSNIVGKPLAALLMQKREGANATVTVAHMATRDLDALCREADILVAAIGSAKFITQHMVSPGCTVIDVGINRLEGKLVGDVDFLHVAPKCRWITPVPGGVGPMTIATLLSNTWLSYRRGMGRI